MVVARAEARWSTGRSAVVNRRGDARPDGNLDVEQAVIVGQIDLLASDIGARTVDISAAAHGDLGRSYDEVAVFTEGGDLRVFAHRDAGSRPLGAGQLQCAARGEAIETVEIGIERGQQQLPDIESGIAAYQNARRRIERDHSASRESAARILQVRDHRSAEDDRIAIGRRLDPVEHGEPALPRSVLEIGCPAIGKKDQRIARVILVREPVEHRGCGGDRECVDTRYRTINIDGAPHDLGKAIESLRPRLRGDRQNRGHSEACSAKQQGQTMIDRAGHIRTSREAGGW